MAGHFNSQPRYHDQISMHCEGRRLRDGTLFKGFPFLKLHKLHYSVCDLAEVVIFLAVSVSVKILFPRGPEQQHP